MIKAQEAGTDETNVLTGTAFEAKRRSGEADSAKSICSLGDFRKGHPFRRLMGMYSSAEGQAVRAEWLLPGPWMKDDDGSRSRSVACRQLEYGNTAEDLRRVSGRLNL